MIRIKETLCSHLINKKLSHLKEKLSEAAVNFVSGAVTKGFGNVVNTINLADKILDRKKEIANRFLPNIDNTIKRVDLLCNVLKKNVMAFTSVDYSFIKINDLKAIKQKNKSSLNVLIRYRQSLLYKYMLEFLKCQYNAWINGQHDNEKMDKPTLEIINKYILNQDFYPLSNADLKNNLAVSSELVETANSILTGDRTNFDGRFMFILTDEQLMSLLFSNLKEPTLLVLNNQNIDPVINNILCDNSTYSELTTFGNIVTEFSSDLKKREHLYIINAILAAAAIILGLIYFVDRETWIEVVVGIILIGYCGYKTIQVSVEMEDIYELKKGTFDLYVTNRFRKIAGYEPKQVTMTKKVEESNNTIMGAIMGGILGFFFIPIPGGLLIGALICAFLCSGDSSNPKGESDGSEYKDIKYGMMWKAYTISFALCALIIYMIRSI